MSTSSEGSGAPPPATFVSLKDKAMPSTVAPNALSLCPTMDLVAVGCNDTTLHLLRSVYWQQLQTLTDPLHRPGLTAVTWAPTGKLLASGLANGSVCVYDPEDAVWDRQAYAHVDAAVSCLHWSRLPGAAKPAATVAVLPRAVVAGIPSPQALPPEGVTYTFPPAEEGGEGDGGGARSPDLDLLCVGAASGRVVFAASAAFVLCDVSVGAAVTAMCLPHTLASFWAVTVGGGAAPHDVSVVELETGVLAARAPQLHQLAAGATRVASALQHVERAVGIMGEQWQSACSVLDDKMSALQRLIRDYDSGGTPQEEFLALYTTGAASGAMSQFLQTVLSDSVLTRMLRTLDTACSMVETLAVTQVARALEGVLVVLSSLRGAVAWEEEFGGLGWAYGDVSGVMAAVQAVLLTTEKLRVAVASARGTYASVFKWCRRAVRPDSEAVAAVGALTAEDHANLSAAFGAGVTRGPHQDWFLPVSVAGFFATDSNPSLVASASALRAVWDAAARQPSAAVSKGVHTRRTLRLPAGGDAPPVACIHYNPDTSWELPSGEEASTGSTVLAFAEPLGHAVHVVRACGRGPLLAAAIDLGPVAGVLSLQPYAHPQGTTTLATTPAIAVLADMGPGEGSSRGTRLSLFDYQDLQFEEVGDAVGDVANLWDAVGGVAAQDHEPSKARDLPPRPTSGADAEAGVELTVMAARGVAVVRLGEKRVMVFDVEDEEEEEEGEGED